MKKSIAFIVSCVLLVLTLATSCAKKEENVWLLNIEKEQKEVACALTIGDEEISYDLFRYWYLNFKEQMYTEDPKIDWTKKENSQKLLDLTIQQLKKTKAIEDLAKKYEFELTDEEKEEVDLQMSTVFNNAGGADAYREALAEKYLTHEVFERVLTADALEAAMEERLVGTDKEQNKIVVSFDEALETFNKDYIRLALVGMHVDIYDDNGNKVDQETFEQRKKAVKANADKAYEKLKNGDFLTLMKDYYSEEDAKLINLQYYFRIAHLNTLSDIDFSKLEVGGVAGPMFVDPTYFILYRMENDAEYLEENQQTYVLPHYVEKRIDEELKEITNAYKVNTTEDYKLISTNTII